jgi:hypothetical protein
MNLLVLPTGIEHLWDSFTTIPRPENTLVTKKFRKFETTGNMFDNIYYPSLRKNIMGEDEEKWFNEEIKPHLKNKGKIIGY